MTKSWSLHHTCRALFLNITSIALKVPLLDISAQHGPIADELRAAVLEVVDSTRYIMGPKIDELEANVAEYCGAQFGIGVSSGTDALLLALMALNIGPGDLVLTTPYSFFATAGVIARVGATPVLVDIDRKSYNIDPQAVAQWIDDNPDKKNKLKAIMPVHLYGQCAAMKELLDIAGPLGLPIIEDAAQAIGAGCDLMGEMQAAGSMGLVGCFSFFPSKNLGGIGDGGFITSNDEGLAHRMKLLRNHGAEPKYFHSMIGGNFRLDPIQAAALLVKLPHLESWHAMRRENAHFYDEALAGSKCFTPHISYSREHHIYNQYVIAVPERRDELKTHLQEAGISTEIYYPVPFHKQECFSYLGYKDGDFPNAEFAANHTLAIPVYPGMTREMQQYVVDKIYEFYG